MVLCSCIQLNLVETCYLLDGFCFLFLMFLLGFNVSHLGCPQVVNLRLLNILSLNVDICFLLIGHEELDYHI